MSACVRCQGLGVIFTAPVTVLWGRSAPYQGQAQVRPELCPVCRGTKVDPNSSGRPVLS